MIFIKALFLFILGSALGSFANVLVDRGQRGKSLLGRSKCDFCGKELSWNENIPILGFFLVKGKCKNCKQELSWQYPGVELAMGLAFLLVGYLSGYLSQLNSMQQNLQVGFQLFITFLLVVVVVWDLKYMIIPNFLVASGLIVALAFEISDYLQNDCSLFDINCGLAENILGAVVISGFFYLMYIFSKGKYIGGGDVKLGFLLGFLVGWKMAYLLLLLAYVLGAMVSIYLLASRRKKMKSQIPFGPFLVAGAFIVLFFGEKLLYWYKMLL